MNVKAELPYKMHVKGLVHVEEGGVFITPRIPFIMGYFGNMFAWILWNTEGKRDNS